MSRALRPVILRARIESPVKEVLVDGKAALLATRNGVLDGSGGWYFDAPDHALWVRVPAGAGPHTVVAGP
ncbi:MAG: hypothetical protein EXR72_12130 [Myxococcales bacterium]|nr:hypothetical protein [Myxococcales bacterium]